MRSTTAPSSRCSGRAAAASPRCLRIIAGFETASAGSVRIHGADVTRLPPHRRPTNMVFQRGALFPHMNVFDNVAYSLKLRKWPRERIRARVEEMLALVRLEGLGGRAASELSGGQSQRVALARALAAEPQVLLLDEPLSALDLKLRQQMQLELRAIQRKLGATFVFVTHDQTEALVMSDRIAIMDRGRVVQVGTPARDLHAAVVAVRVGFHRPDQLPQGHRDRERGRGRDAPHRRRPDAPRRVGGSASAGGDRDAVAPAGGDPARRAAARRPEGRGSAARSRRSSISAAACGSGSRPATRWSGSSFATTRPRASSRASPWC